MIKKQTVFLALSLLLVVVLGLSACQPAAEPVTVIETVVVEEIVQQTVVVEVAPENPAEGFRMAVVFPGVITDADYNTLGYLGATAVETELGVEVAYSESVPVPDVDRVMREYLDAGYNIIWSHGSQFVNQTKDLAIAFPDIVFVAETDGPVADAPANLWVIDRNFHVPYYVIGFIAAKASTTGTIGYIGGPTLPFSYQEARAIDQAIADFELPVEVVRVWTGDFNDPTKGQQQAAALISNNNADVIMGSMNLGMLGIFEAAKSASTEDSKVLVTAKYIDKKNFAPNNYITSALYDFTKPMTEIVGKILAGETGGYYPLVFGSGVSIQLPLSNVDPAIQAEAEQVIQDILDGKIEVVKDATPYE